MTPAVLLGDLTLLRPLVMAKIPAVVVTTDPDDTTLRSRHVRERLVVPELATSEVSEATAKLVALATDIERRFGKRPPLIYGSDDMLALIYKNRAVFERHFAVILNEPGVAEALLYKDAFGELAAMRGVRTPPTFSQGPELDRELAHHTGPIVVKPRSKVRWRELKRALFGPNAKAYVFASGQELLAHPAYEQIRDALIVQELIPGGEEQLVSFHGFADERGELLTWFCGRKIRTFPSPNGESSFIELVVDDGIALYGMEVATRLGLKGPFKIDIIRDPRSELFYTLEVNARFTLWHQLAAADGVNVPEIAYEYLANGVRQGQPKYSPRHRWVNLYRDYKSFRERNEQGQLGVWDWVSSIASRPAVFEAFAWDDPVPAMSWLGGTLGKAFDGATRGYRERLEAAYGATAAVFGRWRSTAF